jgi:diaminopimelate epimerase
MNNVHGIEKIDNDFFLNTGSPHYVKWVNQLEDLDVVQEGRNIRYNNRFKNYGTNVNFIEQLDNQLLIRTYERGVENETLSCGTGNVAAAIVNSIDKENEYFSVNLKTKGGELNVTFQKTDAVTFKDVWLKGPAEFVFEGIY